MDISELLSRSVQALGGDAPAATSAYAAPKSLDPDESFRIRARMIGVLLCDARVSAGRTYDDCAALLKTSPDQIERWELGEETPTLPQLELLAFYMDVPVSHFWGTKTLQATERDYSNAQPQYLLLRERMIGALLRQARDSSGISLDDLALASGIPAETIQAYELGEHALPMHELTVLANILKKNLNYFLESSSHIGELLALREKWKHFADLPEDVREFAANPLNLGFIEIALMLSQMPTDRLRRVGESVINITL